MFESKNIENDLEWLHQVSEKVNFKKDYLEEMISTLDSYCLTHSVFAMAAIQLGFNKRVIYLKNTDLDKWEDTLWNEKMVLVNPVIKCREGLTTDWEACESCLDYTGLVLRPYKTKIEYFDLEGKKHQKTFKGFSSTIFCHEHDHLDGILHIDKALELMIMSREERKEFKKVHAYEIISKTGCFLELEEKYAKKYKNECHANFR